MKRILTLLFAMTVLGSYAQTPIVIELTDIGNVGTTVEQRTDTLISPVIQPGNPGANVSWNFAALHNHLNEQLQLLSPSAVPMNPFFPQANLAQVYTTNPSILFYNRSASGLAFHGGISDYLMNGDSIKMVLTSPDTLISLPGNYLDSHLYYSFGDSRSHCNFSYDTNIGGFPVTVPIDTVRIKHIQYTVSTIDSWGTLTLPNGSASALRQKNEVFYIDSLWGYANVPPPYQTYSGWYFIYGRADSNYLYNWWIKNGSLPVVTMQMEGKTDSIVDLDWLYLPWLGINSTSAAQAGIYPNPASEQITIRNGNDAIDGIDIYDISGRLVVSFTGNRQTSISINVTGLENGVYFARIASAHGNRSTAKYSIRR